MDRTRIRAEFDSRFTAHHMAQNYLKLYSRLIKNSKKKSVHAAADSILTHGSGLAAHAASLATAPGLNAIAGA
jgi:hypothetical protein